GELRDWAHRRIRWLAGGVFAVLFLAFTVTFDYSVLARSNVYARPWALIFPAIGVLALAGILVGTHRQRDALPFAMTGLFFVAAFLGLGAMFWPCSTARCWFCRSSPLTPSASTGSSAARWVWPMADFARISMALLQIVTWNHATASRSLLGFVLPNPGACPW